MLDYPESRNHPTWSNLNVNRRKASEPSFTIFVSPFIDFFTLLKRFMRKPEKLKGKFAFYFYYFSLHTTHNIRSSGMLLICHQTPHQLLFMLHDERNVCWKMPLRMSLHFLKFYYFTHLVALFALFHQHNFEHCHVIQISIRFSLIKLLKLGWSICR